MKRLRIRLERPEQTREFISRIDQALSAGWSRNHTLGMVVSPVDFLIAYSCEQRQSRKAATVLFQVIEDFGAIETFQVVELNEQRPLTHDEANVILCDFNESVLRNITPGITARIAVTADIKAIQDLMPAEAFLCLKQFSASIDKSAKLEVEWGDRERWYDFVIVISRQQHYVTHDSLYRWLIEEERWPEENAKWVAMQFNNSVDLLRYFRKKGDLPSSHS